MAVCGSSEAHVVVVMADERAAEPVGHRLEAPSLPPTAVEDTSPPPALAALSVALLRFPGTAAAERQMREDYRDLPRGKWVW
jgi:hypothetical protein